MKKRGIKEKRIEEKYDIKKTFVFRLLILSLVLLMVLVIVYIFVYESGRGKEERLRGELGTLKWDLNKNYVRLDVLNYNISEDNLTINVNVNWSSGNISDSDFNGVLVDFDMNVGNNCNYTNSSSPIFGENKTYEINSFNPGCIQTDFSNVTNVTAYAQVNIHLNQTSLIQNITFYKDDSRNNLIYLNNYFYALTEINYSLIESPSNDKIEIIINNTTKNISISALDSTWLGTQKFNLTAIENQETLITSFYIIVVNTTRPIPNHPPEFNHTYCDDLVWYKNTTYTLNMTKCWRDTDGDTLTLRYENRSNGNLSISQNGVILTLTPNTNWFGTGYFYLYADDGKISEDESARVDFSVRNLPVANGTNTTTVINNDPKIKSSNPVSSDVSIFPKTNKTFTISAEKYEIIKWYLNGAQVTGSGLSFNFNNLKEGDIVKVEIINGTRIDSKTWNIKIANDETIEQPIFNTGLVIFYAIIVVICIIIILVIWLFIEEKRSKRIPEGFGFVIAGGNNSPMS